MLEDKEYQTHEICKDIKIILEPQSDPNGNLNDQSAKIVQQLVENVDISECFDENNCLKLKKLIIMIKNQFNFPFENKEVYFYLQDVEIFMNCGIDPISQDIKIRPENYQKNSVLTLKGKDLGISMVHRLMSFENNISNSQDKDRKEADQLPQKSKCRRTKERRIGHIIDKVIEWRKYYSGIIDDKNKQVKYSLEDAAKQVNISKKSLDDYLFQIRFGYKYGFNFNQHYNDKVGVLRDFVRQRKRNDKTQNKSRKIQQKELNRNKQYQ